MPHQIKLDVLHNVAKGGRSVQTRRGDAVIHVVRASQCAHPRADVHADPADVIAALPGCLPLLLHRAEPIGARQSSRRAEMAALSYARARCSG